MPACSAMANSRILFCGTGRSSYRRHRVQRCGECFASPSSTLTLAALQHKNATCLKTFVYYRSGHLAAQSIDMRTRIVRWPPHSIAWPSPTIRGRSSTRDAGPSNMPRMRGGWACSVPACQAWPPLRPQRPEWLGQPTERLEAGKAIVNLSAAQPSRFQPKVKLQKFCKKQRVMLDLSHSV